MFSVRVSRLARFRSLGKYEGRLSYFRSFAVRVGRTPITVSATDNFLAVARKFPRPRLAVSLAGETSLWLSILPTRPILVTLVWCG